MFVKQLLETCGTFEFGERTDVTDPCYDRDTWCRMTVDTVPGLYTCFVALGEKRIAWEADRVKAILIVREDWRDNLHEIGEIGVDAGLAGFFNDKPDYAANHTWIDECFQIDKAEAEGKRYYFNDNGFFSSSGYGDGRYKVFGQKAEDGRYNALCIVFIEDEE